MNSLTRHLLLLLVAIVGLTNGYVLTLLYQDGGSDTFSSGLPGHCMPVPPEMIYGFFLNDPEIGVAVTFYDNPTCDGGFIQFWPEGYQTFDAISNIRGFNISAPCLSSVCT